MTFTVPGYWFAGSSDDDDHGRPFHDVSHHAQADTAPARDTLDPRLALSAAEVARRIRDGDALLFGRLFDTYWRPLSRFAALYTRSDDEAEDVTAQVFAALWNTRATWYPRGSLELYLYGAVRNCARNAHRAARRFAWHEAMLTGTGTSPTMGEAQLRADDAVIADERRHIIARVINGLADQPREILMLRWLRGLSFDEIAVVTGVSRNAVYVRYHRALAALRERLPQYFE